MTQLKVFNDTVCEIMNLANGKCLVRDCMGEVNEVYQYELQDIPLSKELLEYLGFRFKEADYKIKGWECYRLTKVEKVYLSPSFFVEEEMYTPLIGYAITADGEERFSIFTRKYTRYTRIYKSYHIRQKLANFGSFFCALFFVV